MRDLLQLPGLQLDNPAALQQLCSTHGIRRYQPGHACEPEMYCIMDTLVAQARSRPLPVSIATLLAGLLQLLAAQLNLKQCWEAAAASLRGGGGGSSKACTAAGNAGARADGCVVLPTASQGMFGCLSTPVLDVHVAVCELPVPYHAPNLQQMLWLEAASLQTSLQNKVLPVNHSSEQARAAADVRKRLPVSVLFLAPEDASGVQPGALMQGTLVALLEPSPRVALDFAMEDDVAPAASTLQAARYGSQSVGEGH